MRRFGGVSQINWRKTTFCFNKREEVVTACHLHFLKCSDHCSTCKNKRTASMLANSRKDHSIPLKSIVSCHVQILYSQLELTYHHSNLQLNTVAWLDTANNIDNSIVWQGSVNQSCFSSLRKLLTHCRIRFSFFSIVTRSNKWC